LKPSVVCFEVKLFVLFGTLCSVGSVLGGAGGAGALVGYAQGIGVAGVGAALVAAADPPGAGACATRKKGINADAASAAWRTVSLMGEAS
jgi:hypothetical protein